MNFSVLFLNIYFVRRRKLAKQNNYNMNSSIEFFYTDFKNYVKLSIHWQSYGSPHKLSSKSIVQKVWKYHCRSRQNFSFSVGLDSERRVKLPEGGNQILIPQYGFKPEFWRSVKIPILWYSKYKLLSEFHNMRLRNRSETINTGIDIWSCTPQ